ncbi:M48 family metallopeptidase [Prosthecobacter sp.]|uniref:M48 family metallopeptidase n=1 Tax=Prosthecobacter sp. TaxID=1965333 RepID=UPI002AB9D9F5|nr:M48 family metallopeptidase [Prosthecobacter sp.]MDZ4404251.1 M48 family metallopeptidase [Prosthecobacter sp.]
MIPTLQRLVHAGHVFIYGDSRGRRGCAFHPRVMLALLIIGGTLVYHWFGTTTYQNEFTGREQKLALATPQEEIALGLQSAPQMIREMGGLSRDPAARAKVDAVGARLIASTAAKQTTYQFKFHLLADARTVNAFALPGGQIFITEALFRRFKSEDQLAGVLGHEMGHVVGRHSNEQMANSRLWSGLAQGIGVLTSDGYNNTGAHIAHMVAQYKVMKFSRDDELESDALGVRFMLQAGYNPEALIGVMEILAEASGGSSGSDFMSSHPSPDNRIEKIREAIARERK